MLIVLLVLALFVVGGCATTSADLKKNPDPWEKYNRKVFKFNTTLDDHVVKPVTRAYQAITPDFVEKGVANLFSNLFDVSNSLNNLLQGKP
ncbi:MAG TPA: VacJ family lipoprotein, partial [Gammaproteobacteria bacterium]|nr:VacJ family lipoprotein [Gammaproteobacteria bacterium]